MLSFFLSEFSFTNTHDSQDSRDEGGISLIAFFHFHLLHKHLGLGGHYCRELTFSHSRTGLEPGTFGFRAQVANH